MTSGFSDSYEDVFYIEKEVRGQNKVASKPYADAIVNDLSIVSGLDTEKFWYVFQEEIDNKPTNIWVMENEEEDEDENVYLSYNVYYNRHYRFHLFKVADHWEVSTRAADPNIVIDMSLANKVEQLLNTILE